MITIVENLLKILEKLEIATSSSELNPVFTSFKFSKGKIEAYNGKIYGYNLYKEVDFEGFVSKKLLLSFLKTFSTKKNISLEKEDSNLNIKCGKFKAKVPLNQFPENSFINIKIRDGDKFPLFSPQIYQICFQVLSPIAGVTASNYNGIFLVENKVYCLDGYQFLKFKVKKSVKDAIVPFEVLQLCWKQDVKKITTNENYFTVETDDCMFFVPIERKIDEELIKKCDKLSEVIKKNPSITFTCPKNILTVLERIKIISNSVPNNLCSLKIKSNVLFLNASNENTVVQESVKVKSDGDFAVKGNWAHIFNLLSFAQDHPIHFVNVDGKGILYISKDGIKYYIAATIYLENEVDNAI